MATIPLKDITFPGLDNTYTIPEIDSTLSTAGKAADAKKVGDELASASDDITALQSGKANIDGYYADLVSGGSTQLLSDMVATDTTPYNYRTAGGSLEIGDREKLKKIVGGTINWNQLIHTSQVDASKTQNGVTITDNRDGTYTVSTDENGATANTYSSLSNANVAFKGGHKYLFCGTPSTGSANTYYSYLAGIVTVYDYGKGLIFAVPTDGEATLVVAYIKQGTVITTPVTFKLQCFDLTAIFGSTIADYIYSLEQAHAGDGVAWFRKYFPKDYYEYNAGELISVSGLSAHKMTGFNQWDEEWESGRYNINTGEASTGNGIRSKNKIRVLPNTSYHMICGNYGNSNTMIFLYYDASENFISYEVKYSLNVDFTTPSNAAYLNFNLQTSSAVTTYNHNICINLHWDGELDGEYEPYEEHSYPLDSDVTLRGIPKLDANNNLYYDGDEYEADGTVTRNIVEYEVTQCGSVGTASTGVQYAAISTGYQSPEELSANNYLSNKYMYSVAAPSTSGWFRILDNSLFIYDSRFTDKETADSILASEKPHFVFRKATPTTEEADPYTEIQNVSNWGTEEFVTTSLVPVGHETAYQPDLRAKIEVAPESPDGDGLYLMKRENGQNSYVAYLGELPSDPTTDGTYTLKCTVSGGTATKTWEADE